MRGTAALRQAAAARTPLIKFVGKRSVPESVDHTPRVHPASPSSQLPDSFATYRNRAQQHGPLGSSSGGGGGGGGGVRSATNYGGAIGGQSASSLGSMQPRPGEYFDRSELPERFQRTPWSDAEIEAIQTGGASMVT